MRTSPQSSFAQRRREESDSPRWQPCGPWWPWPRRRVPAGAGRPRLRGEGRDGGAHRRPTRRRGPARPRERPGAPKPALPSGRRGALHLRSIHTHAGPEAGGPTSRCRPPPGSEGFDASAPPHPEWAEGGWGRPVASTSRICSQIDLVFSLDFEAPARGMRGGPRGERRRPTPSPPTRGVTAVGCQRRKDALRAWRSQWPPAGTHRKCVSETGTKRTTTPRRLCGSACRTERPESRGPGGAVLQPKLRRCRRRSGAGTAGFK